VVTANYEINNVFQKSFQPCTPMNRPFKGNAAVIPRIY